MLVHNLADGPSWRTAGLQDFQSYISKYKQQAGRDLKGGAASRIFWQFQEYWFLSKTSKTHAFLQQVLNPCLFPSNSNLWQNRLSQLLALQLSKRLPGMTNTLRGCMEGWKYHGHDRDWVGKPMKQTVWLSSTPARASLAQWAPQAWVTGIRNEDQQVDVDLGRLVGGCHWDGQTNLNTAL